MAKEICAGCPVREVCLDHALNRREKMGVWGGMTERERRLLLRQRSDVTSWRSILVGKGNSPVREADIMTAEKCARLAIKGMAKRQRERVEGYTPPAPAGVPDPVIRCV